MDEALREYCKTFARCKGGQVKEAGCMLEQTRAIDLTKAARMMRDVKREGLNKLVMDNPFGSWTDVPTTTINGYVDLWVPIEHDLEKAQLGYKFLGSNQEIAWDLETF
ncbi:hypothetical protein ACLOJK_035030 [Asimina triloba]